MTKPFLHQPALEALIATATAPRLWTTQADVAADAGISPPTLTYALRGKRGLSRDALDGLSKAFEKLTGRPASVFADALELPVKAVPGDVRNAALIKALHDTQNELTRLTRLVMTNGD